MNFCIIFLSSVCQQMWWIFASIFFYEDITLMILTIVSLSFRLMSALLKKKQCEQILVTVLHLCYMAAYTEAAFRTPRRNFVANHTSALLLVLNYIETNIEVSKWHLVSKYGYPLYATVRVVSMAFEEANYLYLESSCILLIVLILVVEEQSSKSIQDSNKLSKEEILAQSNLMNGSKPFQYHKVSSSLQKSITQFQAHGAIECENPLRKGRTESLIQNDGQKVHSYMRRSTKPKPSILSATDKQDQQMHQFYHHLFNIFPQGVLIINHNQKSTYHNDKCEKLLECQSIDQVIQKLKSGLALAQLIDDEGSFIKRRNPKEMTQQVLEDIIRQYRQNQQELDVFDALLNPQKYLQNYNVPSPYSEQDHQSSKSGSYGGTQKQQNTKITYNLVQSSCKQGHDDKQLKIIINPSTMSLTLQEQFSVPSQQRVNLCEKKTNSNSLAPSPETQLQPVLLILIKNVTAKHKIEKLKQQHTNQNWLLKSFSHELRTPLNSSYQLLSIVKELVKDSIVASYVNYILISTKLLAYQLNDILDYSAFQSSSFHYQINFFMIEEVVAEVTYIYTEQLKSKSINFQVIMDPQLKNLRVHSDKQRIIQVLVNLINNSSKFTKENGVIKLSMKLVKRKNPNDSDKTKIKVKDNGIGISNEQLEQIKKSFHSRTKSMRKSKLKANSGFGMDVSAPIVEGLTESKDTLQIKSNQQQGTTVYFYIDNHLVVRDETIVNPMISEYTSRNPTFKKSQSNINYIEESPNQIRNSSERSSIIIRNGETPTNRGEQPIRRSKFYQPILENVDLEDESQPNIQLPQSPAYQLKERILSKAVRNSFEWDCGCRQVLIVDDIPFNQIALKAMLIHHKVQPDQAFDGFQAIEMVKRKLSEHCKNYRLIFMDIEMPGINGFQTTREIKRLTTDETKIVICSAYDTMENFNEGYKVGVHDFLPKPVDQNKLEQILFRYLN